MSFFVFGTIVLAATQLYFAPIDVASCILAAAPLLIVPLARDVLAKILTPSWTLPKWAHLIAASCAAIAVAMPPGWPAGLFATPWILLTATYAIVAVRGCVGDAKRPSGAFAGAAAKSFLAVGGAWLFLTCSGLDLFGFGEPIARLTAIHFHYAGFALATIAARVQNALPGRVMKVTLAAILCGIPLVAVGITFRSTAFELASTLLLATASVTLAVAQMIVAIRSQQGTSRNDKAISLLAMSSASLCTAMVLAVSYALGRFRADSILDIPTMVATHGILNAAGFCFLGLLGWRAIDRRN